MLMGLAIECALSRAERQNMLINDLHLTPMQSTALRFFWTEKYKKNQNERGAKIFSALHVNVHVRLTLSICCEAIFTMLDIYVLGNLIVKLGFAKNPFLCPPSDILPHFITCTWFAYHLRTTSKLS